jgi:hypothetical protein
MSKANVTENDFIKFVFNTVSMPSYGSNLFVHLHTADPGEGGTSSTNEAAYTGYARVSTTRIDDATGWKICDADGTPNPNGRAAENNGEVTFPECTGVSDDVLITHASLCTNGGQILYKGALTASIRVTNLITPRFPAGTMIFAED